MSVYLSKMNEEKTVRGVKWTGDNLDEIEEEFGDMIYDVSRDCSDFLLIKTTAMRGDVHLNGGEYLVFTGDEFCTFSADKFEKYFEEVEDGC